MKPGDLVTIRRLNRSNEVLFEVSRSLIWRVPVYDQTSNRDYLERKVKWEHDEIGLILGGRDDIDEMIQVLLKGHPVWAEERMLVTINEAR
jgi:hypothetical protein